MSALLLKANELNQKFNNCLYRAVPLTWDSKQGSWKHEENIGKLLPYYFVNIGLIVIAGLVKITCLVPIMIWYPEVVPLKQKLIMGFFAGGIVTIAMLVDFMMFRYGAELAAAANWCVETKRRCRIPPKFEYGKGLVFTIHMEVHKILGGIRPVDWYGLLGIYVFQGLTVLSILFPTVFVHKKLDPWYIFFNALNSPSLLNLPRFQDHPAFRIFLHLLQLVTTMTLFIAIKTVIIVCLSFFQFQLELLRHLCRMRLTHQQLRLFRQSQITNRLLYEVNKCLFGAFLGMAFYLLLLCMNVNLLGWRILPLNVYLLIPVFTGILVVLLLLLFDFGCGIYETSVEVGVAWRRNLSLVVGPRQMKKILRSLPPVAVPVGHVGIMDRDIKRNYLSVLVSNLVNTLIMFRGRL